VGLRPEERWWLFTVTAAATGFPEHADIGWRKALRFALTENPLAEPPVERVEEAKPRARRGRRKSSASTDSLLLFATENEEESPFLLPSGKPL
jgi:hypothetical protein